MNILTVLGSPRLQGNTNFLLEQAIKGINLAGYSVEIERINIVNKRVAPCTHCGYCETNVTCIIKDDMINLYSKLINCDRLIIASPVYFLSVTAQLKMMIDRCQVFWSNRELCEQTPKRKGIFLATAGSENKGALFDSSAAVIKALFSALKIDYIGNGFADNTDRLPVPDNRQVSEEAFQLGVSLIAEDQESLN